MTTEPEVSVVMAVYNSAATLRLALDSVLSQEGVSLELIVIDDGSTDSTPEILAGAASKDSRVRVVAQQNQGLTRSLVTGCASARGRYLARQDAGGDVSLPGRLRAQLESIRNNPRAALTSCGARFVGPEGEFLFEEVPASQDLTEELRDLEIGSVRGPAAHGATMFPRDAYLRAGGYRPEFAVAQDLDLWLRLVEQGAHVAIPDILYEVSVTADSISGMLRSDQVETTKIILECALRRRSGRSETDLLEEASRLVRKHPARRSRIGRSKTLYFIARCLDSRSPTAARAYYRKAILEFPLYWRPWFFYLTRLARPE